MKILNLILMSCLCLVAAACDKTGNDAGPAPLENTVHLMVEGEPFLMLGAQLRTDYFIQLDGKSYDELDPYFELAAKTNILVVSVPICWRDIEKTRDEYDMSLVYKYIELCEKYGMKLELLWYGSYMCGYSVEGYIPDYVVSDNVTYPELKPEAAYQGWLGKQYYLDPGTPALAEREAKALGAMMDALSEYDREHGKRHTVIGIQIENEPDMLATRHNSAHGYSPEQLWPDLIRLLDRLGQVVKDSPYECYTRVNQTTTYSDYNARAAEIAATEGIDYVGVDPYENTLYNIELKLKWLMNIPGNYPHIAENGGEYANNDVLMMKAISLGCGYQIFEVVTTPHEYLQDWTLRGIYNPDFSFKPHTQQIIDAFGILRGGWVDLACADAGNIAGFNVTDDNGLKETSASGRTRSAGITWSTSSRGIAYAVENAGHITAASTRDDAMTFDGISISRVETGRYGIDRNWVTEDVIDVSGNKLDMEPGKVYRIEF